MDKATEVVVSGCSAGGLAVYLGLDRIRDIIRAENPLSKVTGLALSSFFLEFSSDLRLSHEEITKDDGVVDGRLDYARAMRNVFAFMNISAGASSNCLRNRASKGGHVSDCIFANYLMPTIETPLFHIQVIIRFRVNCLNQLTYHALPLIAKI
jgi:hypothetical protein